MFHTPSFTHTIFHTSSFTHNLLHTPSLTHHLSHTSLSTTIFHTPSFPHHLLHTPSFTHHLCQPSLSTTIHLSHTIFHTSSFKHFQTPSFTHIFVNNNLSHATPSFTHTILHITSLTHHLGDIHLHFAWQAWHLWHWAGSGGALGPVLVAGDAAALCVAGVALGDIHLRFTWQAWHLATSTSTLRGRRGTYGTGLALVACLGPFWSPTALCGHLATSTFVSRGKRGTWRHPPPLCVAGVALMALDRL